MSNEEGDFLKNVLLEPVFAVDFTIIGGFAMGITEVFATLTSGAAKALGQDVGYEPGDAIGSWWKTTKKKWKDVFTWD